METLAMRQTMVAEVGGRSGLSVDMREELMGLSRGDGALLV
jgi:hypothetical protein